MAYTIEDKIKNEDGLWAHVDNHDTYIPNLPPRITFITSKRCNLACRFCYHFTHKYFEKQSPLNQPVMDERLIHKVAEEMFPTLQYYETTLLGDPFLSPHFDLEIELAGRYNVYFRPTTNGTTVTDSAIDKISGRMDWLKCSFDSHIRSIYNNIRIGARFENTFRKLKNFSKRRWQMDPVPYFRVGMVLNDLNLETLPEYIIWCHEELGVDDVEVMGLNVDADHIESLGVFDKADLVNKVLDQAIETALTKKYKLRLDYTQMPEPGGDRFVCQKRSAELVKAQQHLGFIPPKGFEQMSYVIKNPRNRWEIGDLGYVWSNNMRRQDVCVEFFNRPFIIENGNVEACGNCNTFLVGNLKHQNFSEIWNCELYQDVRRKMYNGKINEDWYDACNSCICMGVTYDRDRSDHRHKAFYRLTTTEEKGEDRKPVGETHGPVGWPHEYENEKYFKRITEVQEYKVFLADEESLYLSDLKMKEYSKITAGIGIDKVNTYTPLLLSGKRYIKGIYVDAFANLLYDIPEGYKKFKATIGLFDSENAERHILDDKPGFAGNIQMEVLLDGELVYNSGKIDSTMKAIDLTFDIEGKRLISLISDHVDYKQKGHGWTIWANARFTKE